MRRSTLPERPDSPWQLEFEEAFDYVETEDQLRCIAEIKKDMEKPVPMERLLCGDVGYGKTEVALRAVMKCVLDGGASQLVQLGGVDLAVGPQTAAADILADLVQPCGGNIEAVAPGGFLWGPCPPARSIPRFPWRCSPKGSLLPEPPASRPPRRQNGTTGKRFSATPTSPWGTWWFTPPTAWAGSRASARCPWTPAAR